VSCEQRRLTLAHTRLREILPPSDPLLCLLAGEWNQLKRQSRSAPSPRAPGLPGARLILRKSGKLDLRWGRAGEGGRCCCA
jgi:hypothetical protein